MRCTRRRLCFVLCVRGRLCRLLLRGSEGVGLRGGSLVFRVGQNQVKSFYEC